MWPYRNWPVWRGRPQHYRAEWRRRTARSATDICTEMPHITLTVLLIYLISVLMYLGSTHVKQRNSVVVPTRKTVAAGHRHIATGAEWAGWGGVSESPAHTETQRHLEASKKLGNREASEREGNSSPTWVRMVCSHGHNNKFSETDYVLINQGVFFFHKKKQTLT